MGDIDKMLAETNQQMETSKKLLQELANEVTALAEVVQPALEKQIAALRSARMATVNEIQQTLVALRDIRKFFLEDDYQKELERLRDFVELCQLLKELKEAGVLDAVADTMIRLAIKT